MIRFGFAIVLAALVVGPAARNVASAEEYGTIGINVVLDQPVSDALLADLGTHGQVLDVIPEIGAVTLRARASELAAIQALDYVAAANPDVKRYLTGTPIAVPDFAGGANLWNLDAINVSEVGAGRTVDYDGEGVYVAVIDSGLPANWREYYPEERIATGFARAFGGGGGERGTVSSQPDKWERDQAGHGNAVTSVILGFRYEGPEDLPTQFNGVAPKATIIPVKVIGNNHDGWVWSSTSARGFLYVTDLKRSGALGGAPVVVNFSVGGPVFDAMEKAAIDYAIANGVIVVAGAGNGGDDGMMYPAAYAPVISSSATAPAAMFPEDDPTFIEWILRDIAEDDEEEHVIVAFSGRELTGQDLDVAAPGFPIAVPFTNQGKVDYAFVGGNSFSGPHVAGVVALMLEKNPNLAAAEVEEILEDSAKLLPPDCRVVRVPVAGAGDEPTWSDKENVSFVEVTWCWDTDATGSGLLQADAALAATPLP